jgi:hypothetical protein
MTVNRTKGNDHKYHTHVTETPDVSYIANPDVTHELSDVNIYAILKFIGALSIMTVVVMGLMLFLFNVLNSQRSKHDQQAPPGPMAMTEAERLPPQPRLQAAKGFGVKLEDGEWVDLESDRVPSQPQAEYRVLRQQWERMLQTGKYTESDTTAALPIEEAMKKLLESGTLRTREQSKGLVTWQEHAIRMPTAASSGRISEMRKQ